MLGGAGGLVKGREGGLRRRELGGGWKNVLLLVFGLLGCVACFWAVAGWMTAAAVVSTEIVVRSGLQNSLNSVADSAGEWPVEGFVRPKPRVLAAMPKQARLSESSAFQSFLAQNDSEPVTIVLYDNSGGTPFYWGDGDVIPAPNYGGFDIRKSACSRRCEITRSRDRLAEADAVLFDPCYSGPSQWREVMRHQPARYEGQQWWWFSYEQREYFPQMKRPELMGVFDYALSYSLEADVHMSYMCPWGGEYDWLDLPVPFERKTGLVAFMASNCGTGGAAERTEYVRELMKYIPVDSYGHCLHNRKLPEGERGWVGSFGDMMRRKVALLRNYKFFLAFENNNVTDYVTEKVATAWLAGAVPVYMGSATIDHWAPEPEALLRTDRFESPRALAEHLLRLAEHKESYERHLAWKRRKELSPGFQRIVDHCLFFMECRLCDAVAFYRRKIREEPSLSCRRHPSQRELALSFNRLDMALKQRRDGLAARLDGVELDGELSVAAWVQPTLLGDGRIVDKMTARQAEVGFAVDLLKDAALPVARLRFCGAGNCFTGSRTLPRNVWHHVAITFRPNAKEGLRLYVNGVEDARFSTEGRALKPSAHDLHVGMPAELNSHWSPHHGEGIYEGQLDDISVWTVELGPEDVRLLAHRKLCGNEPGLLLAYPFNLDSAPADSAPTTVLDIGPFAFHARVLGSPTYLPSVAKPIADLTLLHGRPGLY